MEGIWFLREEVNQLVRVGGPREPRGGGAGGQAHHQEVQDPEGRHQLKVFVKNEMNEKCL